MAKKAKSGEDIQKQRLEDELKSLLPGIKEEGLVFLIKQANTIIHNQRTAQLNREIDELNKKKGDKPGGKQKETAQPPSEAYEIEIDRSESGKNYHFIINGRKHFFDIAETRKIIALCYRPQTKSAALKYLYEFFSAERDDILLDHNIESARSPFFDVLFREVRAVFTLDD